MFFRKLSRSYFPGRGPGKNVFPQEELIINLLIFITMLYYTIKQYLKCKFGFHDWHEIEDTADFGLYRYCLQCGKKQEMYQGDWYNKKDLEKKFEL